jgi:hypothetical protein
VSPQADAVVIPLEVAAQWLAWLTNTPAGPERVRADLADLLARSGPPPDPPSSVDPGISTR